MVYFVVIWYILSRFGELHQEKSGKPALNVPKRDTYNIGIYTCDAFPHITCFLTRC
jgi:hypothetical protein